MKTPHKHAAIIKAWADGEPIQIRHDGRIWLDINQPGWSTESEYRIKPEPKPDVIKLRRVYLDPHGVSISHAMTPNILLTFDGETSELKSVDLIK